MVHDRRVPELVAEAVEHLRVAGVTLRQGLSAGEWTTVEERFGLTFGPEDRGLLTIALPSGDPWVAWRKLLARRSTSSTRLADRRRHLRRTPRWLLALIMGRAAPSP